MSVGKRILVATHPFGVAGAKPKDILEASGHEIIYNPHGRRLKAGEVDEVLEDVDAVIAGTELYCSETLARHPRLKVISRVGVGLDSLDVADCLERGITVTYTPDAPSQAVAELTMAFILDLARHVRESDHSVREQAWNRMMGVLIEELTVGIVGVGRIGSRVIKLLRPFGCKVLATDIDPAPESVADCEVEWVDIDSLLSHSDVVSLHIPLNKANHHFLNKDRMKQMKKGSMLINTSRGAVVDEDALCEALETGHLAACALDVFEREPYEGPLATMEQTLLTAHMGASARKSRYQMELGAVEDCLRVLAGETPLNPAPAEEV